MACSVLLITDQLATCGPTTASLARPVSAKLINASSVESFTVASGVATITRVAGTPKAADLECSNGATIVTIGVKGGEVYPQTLDVTITTKMFNAGARTAYNGGLALTTGGANVKAIIAVDHGNGIYRVYGLGVPLECLSIEGNSESDGFLSATFGVEEWQTGTTLCALTEADYVALSTAVPGGGG